MKIYTTDELVNRVITSTQIDGDRLRLTLDGGEVVDIWHVVTDDGELSGPLITTSGMTASQLFELMVAQTIAVHKREIVANVARNSAIAAMRKS